MNPHASHPTSFSALLRGLWINRALIFQMSRREVLGRYKGSILGLLWSFLNPLLMLSVYTFFFAVVFKSRWGGTVTEVTESKTQFAVILFAGMIVHSLFSEVLSRAPGLILSNINYVKKVVFPLEILAVISMLTALFHSMVSIFVLLIVFVAFNGYLHWTVIFLPLVIIPFVSLIMGLAWILASVGVYVRDVGQSIGLAMTVLMFLSPVFYPVSALPSFLQPWIMLNPLTIIIEQVREVVVWGQMPNWSYLGLYALIALFVSWIGFAWFQKTRKGFADVV